jgi:hypothetical protein
MSSVKVKDVIRKLNSIVEENPELGEEDILDITTTKINGVVEIIAFDSGNEKYFSRGAITYQNIIEE